MGDTFQQVLIPLEQAIIWFHGYELVAVRLPDNRVAAVLNSLCAMLGIRTHGQARRIRRQKDLAEHLALALVETPGGPQRMDVLVAEALPFWVLGVQIEQLAPEKRPLILALKEEAVEVLYRHFYQSNPEPAAPPQGERPTVSSDSPAQMIAEVAQAMGEAAQLIVGAVQTLGNIAQRIEAHQQATDEHLLTLDTQHAAMQETQQTMGTRLPTLEGQREVAQEWQHALGDYLVETRERQEVAEEHWKALGDYVVETKERVTALEQRGRAAPAPNEGDAPLAGSPILSSQHLARLYALTREARRQRGTPVSAQLAALAEAFGVADVSDLPESAWEDVQDWFWQQPRPS